VGVTPAPGSVQIFADPGVLAEAAAQLAVRVLQAAVAAHGDGIWVLAGGSTPLAAYRLLAAEPLAGSVPWERVRVVMGDERAVPVTDPDSNWGQAAGALLDRVPIPDAGRIRPRVELGLDAAAEDYERRLHALPTGSSGWPRLNLVWLGAGEDGHTLSLFPGRPEADVTDRLVVAVRGAPKPPPERLGLTPAALRGAGCCAVLAAGAGKADALARALGGDDSLALARAAREVAAAGGTLTWLLDEAAASRLPASVEVSRPAVPGSRPAPR
jgi:6-phosphogluconolactonase